jgi:hypothetical protein
MSYLSCHYLYISFIFCTCWVPTISVLNLVIFSCYSDLLLRRRRWTGILRRWVLGYVLLRLPFLWCYGVFRCSVSLRVISVFEDIIYVIIIIYICDIWLSVSTFGRMCRIIDPGSCIRWVLDFGIKLGMTQAERQPSIFLSRHWLGFLREISFPSSTSVLLLLFFSAPSLWLQISLSVQDLVPKFVLPSVNFSLPCRCAPRERVQVIILLKVLVFWLPPWLCSQSVR